MILNVDSSYIELLNKALAREIQVSAQYLVQHTKMEKLLRKVIPENILEEDATYDQIGAFLKTIGIEEMKHMEAIIERIVLLGGVPTTKPSSITIGSSIKEFCVLGYKAEEEALELYRQVIDKANEIGDKETWKLFTDIYSSEEEHLLKFQEYMDIEEEPDLGDSKALSWLNIFSDEYIAMLNKALAMEISAIIQYATQHEMKNVEALRQKKTALEVVKGKNKVSVISDILKKHARDEMKHMEMIAERIFEVDKEALANVEPKPMLGKSAEDFIQYGIKAENDAILHYRKVIAEANKLGDTTTKRMFEDILMQEEDHYWALDDYRP